GKSRSIRDAIELARRVSAARRTTVLLVGETGTGKELFARGIHYSSAAAHEPFVAINCPAIPESLLESELFGHERGAFTGALTDRPGLFEHAAGGTLFLDEITEMTTALQAKLLRVLETRKFRRVGGREERLSDLRILAATNRDPDSSVREGR